MVVTNRKLRRQPYLYTDHISTGYGMQVPAQRQASLGLPQNVIRPGSVGAMQRQPSVGLPQTGSIATQRQVTVKMNETCAVISAADCSTKVAKGKCCRV